MVKNLARRVREDRGQVIIFFVGFFTLMTVVGVITFDFGVWFNSRRSLQTDADMSALAGAQELAKDLRAAPGGAEDVTWGHLAQQMASDYLGANGLEADTTTTPSPGTCPAHDDLGDDSRDAFICADTSCFAGEADIGLLDTVVVDVQGPSQAVFGRIFGASFLEVGAHAKACVGSLTGTTGLRPWAISMYNSPCFEQINGLYLPLFGQDCVLRSDEPSHTGSIGLGPRVDDPCDSGSASGDDYNTNIVAGSQSWCEIGDEIQMVPGFKTGATVHALRDLFSTEGECDAKFGTPPDGTDDFAEAFTPEDVVPSPDVVYSARECVTPRAVDIVILDDWCEEDSKCSRDTEEILGFASFFIIGCAEVNGGVVGPIDRHCDLSGGDFAIIGRFMNILKLEGAGGPLDPFGTRVIFLVE